MLSPAGKKAAIAMGVMLLTLIASGALPAGEARLYSFIFHLIALGCALWFYARAKGYGPFIHAYGMGHNVKLWQGLCYVSRPLRVLVPWHTH